MMVFHHEGYPDGMYVCLGCALRNNSHTCVTQRLAISCCLYAWSQSTSQGYYCCTAVFYCCTTELWSFLLLLLAMCV